MREVDVYNVYVERAFLSEGKDIFLYFPPSSIRSVYGVEETSYISYHLPVEHLVDGENHYYIAIQPEVTKLLDAKYKAAYKERLAEKERLHKQAVDVVKLKTARIDSFNNLPWYSRIWKAIFKEV